MFSSRSFFFSRSFFSVFEYNNLVIIIYLFQKKNVEKLLCRDLHIQLHELENIIYMASNGLLYNRGKFWEEYGKDREGKWNRIGHGKRKYQRILCHRTICSRSLLENNLGVCLPTHFWSFLNIIQIHRSLNCLLCLLSYSY